MKEPKLLYGYDREVAEWVKKSIGNEDIDFGEKFVSVGILNGTGDRMIGGVVFNQYSEKYRRIQVNIATESPLWATKATIRALLDLPFNKLNCYRVWVQTELKNERAVNAAVHAGFKRESALAHHLGPGNHALILRMLKPDYERIYLNGR